MKAKTKQLLIEAEQYCTDNDKSTEFMLQYMQDTANVDLDCVIEYLEQSSKLLVLPKAYFAHSKLIYNTNSEASAIKFLQKNYTVLDPNKDLGELVFIEYYLKAIDTCNLLIVNPYLGFIGKGAYEEIIHALSKNMPVLVLKYHTIDGYTLYPLIKVYTYDTDDWKFKYGKVLF